MKAREKEKLERDFFRLMASDYTAEPSEGLFRAKRAAKPRALAKPRAAAGKRSGRRSAALSGEEYARFFSTEGAPQGVFSF